MGLFCAPLMTSETSCVDVTVMDSSFPPTGRVGELWEVWSSLIVQTVHPVLVNYRRMWIQRLFMIRFTTIKILHFHKYIEVNYQVQLILSF